MPVINEDIRNALIATNPLPTLLQIIEQSVQTTRDLVEYLWILRGILYQNATILQHFLELKGHERLSQLSTRIMGPESTLATQLILFIFEDCGSIQQQVKAATNVSVPLPIDKTTTPSLPAYRSPSKGFISAVSNVSTSPNQVLKTDVTSYFDSTTQTNLDISGFLSPNPLTLYVQAEDSSETYEVYLDLPTRANLFQQCAEILQTQHDNIEKITKVTPEREITIATDKNVTNLRDYDMVRVYFKKQSK